MSTDYCCVASQNAGKQPAMNIQAWGGRQGSIPPSRFIPGPRTHETGYNPVRLLKRLYFLPCLLACLLASLLACLLYFLACLSTCLLLDYLPKFCPMTSLLACLLDWLLTCVLIACLLASLLVCLFDCMHAYRLLTCLHPWIFNAC